MKVATLGDVKHGAYNHQPLLVISAAAITAAADAVTTFYILSLYFCRLAMY